MNLYVLGWDLDESIRAGVLEQLCAMASVFPQCDPGTVWSSIRGHCLAASMHPAIAACGPRRYVMQSTNEVVLYDGAMVDRTDRFNASDSRELALNWDVLDAALEGQFSAARVHFISDEIEVLTDFLGMAQVYYCRAGRGWAISNSVRVLSALANLRTIDRIGASLMMSLGWVSIDRTLADGIRTIPGGARWTWSAREDGPSRRSYHSPRALATIKRRRRFGRHDAVILHGQLAAMCQTLGRARGNLECPVTSGRDSRVLVSLLQAAQIPAHYYTDGVPGNIDTEVASAIARALQLPHTPRSKPVEQLIGEWSELARRLILQNDGMVSLWQIADVIGQPQHVDTLGTSLWGIGGEIARRYYGAPGWYMQTRSTLGHFLPSRLLSSHAGLVRRDALQVAATCLQEWVDLRLEEGWRPVDIPDVFYAYERVRRWGGSNARKALPVYDLFTPFCTRPFVEASFSLPALYRYSEPLHYQLLRLNPLLHRIAFGKEPWRSQSPALNLFGTLWRKNVGSIAVAKTFARPYDQTAVLAAKAKKVREICLDQTDANLWYVIERNALDRMLARGDLRELGTARLSALYAAVTLCYYASMRDVNSSNVVRID